MDPWNVAPWFCEMIVHRETTFVSNLNLRVFSTHSPVTDRAVSNTLTNYQFCSKKIEQQCDGPHDEGIEEANEGEEERHLCDGPKAEHALIDHLMVVVVALRSVIEVDRSLCGRAPQLGRWRLA